MDIYSKVRRKQMFGKKGSRKNKNYTRTSTGRKINMTSTSGSRRQQGIQMGRGYGKPKPKYFMDRILDPLEKKYGRYALKDLMMYIVGGMGLVYLFNLYTDANPNLDFTLADVLSFDREMILKGQVWRIITFIFIPENTSVIFIVFELYLCWLIGASLQKQWGAFRFNTYYIMGMIGCIAAGFISGYTSNLYLNMSLFIAFALFFPNEEFLIFFVLPVKVKWLAIIDGVLLAAMFLMGGMRIKIVILFSLANLLLFFGKDIYIEVRYFIKKHMK